MRKLELFPDDKRQVVSANIVMVGKDYRIEVASATLSSGERIMPKKKWKPHEERKPEDYMEAADNALELAKVLAGQGGISDQDFLERMARSDELVDHDGKTCGQCHYTLLGAEVAREMIEAGEYEDVASKWAAEHKRRWEKSKFFKLWEKEQKAGRDPHNAFKDRGWEP